MHFVIAGSILGKILPEELQAALARVQQRHPLLNKRIESDESGIPWLIKASNQIPIRIVERNNANSWKLEIEGELRNPFDPSEAPLARVVLVRGEQISELIIVCDHSISDGMSSVFLLRDILQGIGQPDQLMISLAERTSYEQMLLGHRPSNEVTYSEIVSSIKTRPKLPHNSRPCLHTWSFAEPKTAAIINKCRSQKTSVHAAICAACLVSFSEIHNINRILKCLTPVNIRGMLPEIEDDFGYYFTAITTSHNITPNLSIWDLARSVKSQLNEAISPSTIFAKIPHLEAFLSGSPSRLEVVKMLDVANAHDVLISNLGKIEIPEEYGKLRLTGIYGPSLMSYMDRELIVGVATFAGKMQICITYDGLHFPSSQIEQFQEKAMGLLLSQDSLAS